MLPHAVCSAIRTDGFLVQVQEATALRSCRRCRYEPTAKWLGWIKNPFKYALWLVTRLEGLSGEFKSSALW
jgi:hypothetical protein